MISQKLKFSLRNIKLSRCIGTSRLRWGLRRFFETLKLLSQMLDVGGIHSQPYSPTVLLFFAKMDSANNCSWSRVKSRRPSSFISKLGNKISFFAQFGCLLKCSKFFHNFINFVQDGFGFF